MRRSGTKAAPARGAKHTQRNQAISPVGVASVLCMVIGLSACGTTHHSNSAKARGDARAGDPAPLRQTVPDRTDDGKSTGKTTPDATTIDRALRPGVIAVVGQHSISKQALDHWIKVEAAIQYQARPTRPVPRGVVPDPPSYHDCIGYLASLAKARHARPTPSTPPLKAQCALKRKALLTGTLEKLIVHYWIHDEAAKAGIKLTSREINRALDKRFPTKASFHRFLAYTGMRASDEKVILEEQLLPDKWQRAILPVYARVRRIKSPETDQMVREVDDELAILTKRVTERWTARTHCSPADVISVCSEFAK